MISPTPIPRICPTDLCFNGPLAFEYGALVSMLSYLLYYVFWAEMFLSVSELVCFQDAPLWLTTGSSNQQCGKVATFPFTLVTSSPPLSPYNRDTSITLPSLRVKGQSHFSALSVPFSPRTDPLPEVKASCHLNSHQFTRGEGVVSVGNSTYYLSFPPPSPTHRVE